jgi:hypothetical protein
VAKGGLVTSVINAFAITSESQYLSPVLDLHNKAKATLGFLPESVFKEQADKGCLLVALDRSNQVGGYALYALPRREVRLIHLCVAYDFRGQGCARMLVDDISRRHPNRLGIRVSCRRDFPAHSLWPHLDFAPLGDRPGRSAEGHLLTIWWRDFGHPTLFTRDISGNDRIATVAVDTDVFIDLDSSLQPSRSDESLSLLSNWIEDTTQVVITKEVAIELNRQRDDLLRKRQLERAESFAHAGETTQAFASSKKALLELLKIPPTNEHDISDANQIARTHAAGIGIFITRDGNLRRSLTAPASELGVTITTPGEYVSSLWAADNEYSPANLQDTHYGLVPLQSLSLREVVTAFLNSSAGEKKNHLERILRELGAESKIDGRVVVAGDGAMAALMVRKISRGIVEVPVLRLSQSADIAVSRHIAHLQITFARLSQLSIVRITDSFISEPLVAALKDERFVDVKSEWWAATVTRIAKRPALAKDIENLRGVPEEFGLARMSSLLKRRHLSYELESELEEMFWPMKIRGASLPSFLIPIHPTFARELFDSGLSRDTLFRQKPLGVYREQVYYRSSSASGGLRAPARLLWYVKKIPGVAGSGMVRACSRLLEVDVDRPRTLFRRNSRLGVYSMSDVEHASKGRLAMALKFGLTEEFQHPVGLKDVRLIALARGCSNVQLQSPWRLPDGAFDDIYERATNGSE